MYKFYINKDKYKLILRRIYYNYNYKYIITVIIIIIILINESDMRCGE